MKKFRLLLAVVLASLCSIQGMRAERTAPTFPSDQAKTLESGQTYYLYNVGSGQFVYRYTFTSYVRANSTSRESVVITSVDEGLYTIQFSSNNHYWYMSSGGTSEMYYSGNPSTSYRYFRIAETEGGYTIQRNYSYNENHFVGNSSGYYVYANLTSGNIVWQLYDEDGVNAIIHYRAKKALYDALEAAADYSIFLDSYEEIYDNELSTTEELSAAATELANSVAWSNAVAKHSLHDNPILLVGNGWQIGAQSTSNTNLISRTAGTGNTMEIKGLVDVSETSTIYYKMYGQNSYTLQTYVDGELVRSLNGNQFYNTYYYGYCDLIPEGKHEIVWKFTASSSAQLQFEEIGVISTPQISVNLLEAGSLGTEVLYNVDNIKDVRNLKIKGKMNSEDWAKIKMMNRLFLLDLTETEIKEIPASLFGSEYNSIGSYSRLSCANNLYSIKLPSQLQTIGKAAFANSLAEDFNIPSTVTTIGNGAFSGSRIKNANLSNVISIPDYAFNSCILLEELSLSDNLETVGSEAFSGCSSIAPQTINLPSSLTTIEDNAFRNCSSINFRFPDKYLTIYREAFNGTAIDSLILHQSWSSVNDTWSPFYAMSKLVYAEIPTMVTSINLSTMLSSCPNLNKVVLRSPTKVTANEAKMNLSTKTIVVPSYLVNTYKLDSYWYNAKAIEGFSTADIKDWTINAGLTMNEHERFEGNPNIVLNSSWKVNGTDAQTIDNFTISRGNGMVLSNCDNMSITGNLIVNYTMSALSWYFVCLPFDIKVSDISCTNGARFAIRYYDGANRAANGTGGNWKDYAADATITAGTGFIIQTSKACNTYFKSLNNASKQYAVSNNIFVKALDAHVSEQNSNKGWNLVGNPWLCYYNIHKMNFTGAITVYNGYNRTYKAYSIIDDDYAILPGEAFFVQCPDEVTEISFPVDGRQLTSVIESQNGAKAETPQEQTRWLVDVELSDGEQSDQTRFVLNEKASMSYETSCDASKFFEDGTACPQLFTIEDLEPLAINERPLNDGTVQLGMIVAKSGTYTINATRNQFQHLYLIDYETGRETDLATDSYTFNAEAGTDNTRFELRFNNSSIATSVEAVPNARHANEQAVFNLAGQRIAQPQKGVYIINGKKAVIK